jgi:hypothetical protein
VIACEGCGHPLVFHELGHPEDPCYYCPRGECKVGKCGCNKYTGPSLSQDPHEYHSTGVQWGSWGKVQFMGAGEISGSSWLTPKPQQKRELSG